MVTRMSAAEARHKFSDVMNRAYYQGEPTIVERQGKPVVAIISAEQYEQYERFQQQQKRGLFETNQKIQKQNKDADPDEVYGDVAEAVEDVRRTGRPRLIQADGEDIAVLMPAPKRKRLVTKSKPVTAHDPLFRLIGIGQSTTEGGISEKKHEYLLRAKRAHE